MSLMICFYCQENSRRIYLAQLFCGLENLALLILRKHEPVLRAKANVLN